MCHCRRSRTFLSGNPVAGLLLTAPGRHLFVQPDKKNTGCFPSNSKMPQLAFVPTSVSPYVRDPIYGHGHQWNYQLTPFDRIVHVQQKCWLIDWVRSGRHCFKLIPFSSLGKKDIGCQTHWQRQYLLPYDLLHPRVRCTLFVVISIRDSPLYHTFFASVCWCWACDTQLIWYQVSAFTVVKSRLALRSPCCLFVTIQNTQGNGCWMRPSDYIHRQSSFRDQTNIYKKNKDRWVFCSVSLLHSWHWILFTQNMFLNDSK